MPLGDFLPDLRLPEWTRARPGPARITDREFLYSCNQDLSSLRHCDISYW